MQRRASCRGPPTKAPSRRRCPSKRTIACVDLNCREDWPSALQYILDRLDEVSCAMRAVKKRCATVAECILQIVYDFPKPTTPPSADPLSSSSNAKHTIAAASPDIQPRVADCRQGKCPTYYSAPTPSPHLLKHSFAVGFARLPVRNHKLLQLNTKCSLQELCEESSSHNPAVSRTRS